MDTGVPSVAHYRTVFPVLSETFVRESVARLERYRSVVITHRHGSDSATAVRTVLIPEGRMSTALGWSTAAMIAWRARLLRRALAQLAPDVLHAHFGEDAVPAARAAARLGIPLVASFYGYDATELARRKLWRRRFRGLFARAAAVLAEGPRMRDRLIALGAHPDRVLVHRIPLRLELFPFREPQPPPAGAPLVLFQACRFVEKKGVDVTIRAFERLAGEHPTAILWLMGSGPEERALKALAATSEHGDRIRFLPPAGHEAYAATLRQAHLLVHPSRTARGGDGEGGAPTVILEAQAAGLPIVSTTHADIPSVVDPRAALLAAEDDVDGITAHLRHLIRNPEEWAARAHAGRTHVEAHHDPHALAVQLEGIYDSVRR